MNKTNLIMVGGITSSLIMVVIVFLGILTKGSYTAIENNSWILYGELTFLSMLSIWWFKNLITLSRKERLVIKI